MTVSGGPLPDMPSISIGIVTLNSGRTLRQCLKAVFSQGYARDKLDVFVVDAGSTDDTLAIAEDFEVSAYSEAGCTRGRARNICIQKARAEIFVMLDSDVVIPNGWLMAAEKYFTDPEVVSVSSPYFTPEPRGGVIRRVIYYLTSGYEFHTHRALKRENWVTE